MSKFASRTISSFVAALPLALAVAGSSVSAQTMQPQPRALGVYAGANAGVGVYEWDCGTSCGRTSFSGKLFGGKRLTPGLAAEINYMFFGRVDNANSPTLAAATGISAEKRKVSAITVGINWEVELLHDVTNHLRIGMARVKRDSDIERVGGAVESVSSYRTAPHVGAGLSLQVVRDIRINTNFDYIIDGDNSMYLFSVGGSFEF
jgi:opacity protein-like surface antigen